MKVRLNKTVIDEAVYEGPGGCYLWDERLTGFGVRIYPSGTKSFVVTYWCRGRQRFFTIGRYGKITLHQAKEDALEVFLKVHRGEDPAADRKAAKSEPTVADLADRHIEDQAKLKNKAGEHSSGNRARLCRVEHRGISFAWPGSRGGVSSIGAVSGLGSPVLPWASTGLLECGEMSTTSPRDNDNLYLPRSAPADLARRL